MTTWLIRAGIFLGTAALGLILTSWLLSDFTLSFSGFLLAVVVFAVAQSLLAPVATKLARQHASALLGVVGLASTFVALLVTTLLPGGLSIRGLATWVLATLFVWLITALGTWLLPMLFLRDRDRLTDRTGKRRP